jgi:putative sigma-54 modulation protein
MRLEVTGRHLEITAALRRLVDKKIARLERMLNDSAVSAQVVLSQEKRGRRADVTLHARGEKFLHGVGVAANWEASLSQATDKITQQAHKIKGKWQQRRRRGSSVKAPIEPAAGTPPASPAAARERARMPRIIRTARQPLAPMSVADAARQVDANGTGAVIFRDAETAAVSVLFRRPDGELMLVEAEL